jgi:hypothetical protein
VSQRPETRRQQFFLVFDDHRRRHQHHGTAAAAVPDADRKTAIHPRWSEGLAAVPASKPVTQPAPTDDIRRDHKRRHTIRAPTLVLEVGELGPGLRILEHVTTIMTTQLAPGHERRSQLL